jgi:hypothetical protein
MNKDTPTFLFGMSWGIVLFVILISLPFTYNSKAQKAIQECEKTLPRNQHCEITAIPVLENSP